VHSGQNRIRIAAAALVGALVLGTAPAANAQRESGIQLTPDSAQYLINKDVPPNQRWAISWNLSDKTITGNVFFTDDSQPPQFLWCEELTDQSQPSPNPAESQFVFRCYGAGPCEQAPCSSASFLQIADVTLPGSFLYPPGTTSTLRGNVQPTYNQSCATSAVCHGNGAQYVVLSPLVSWQNTFLVESDGVNGMQGPFIAPFDPAGSFLFRKLDGTGAGERMPYNGSPLPPDQIEAVRNWILEGAANN